MTVTKNHKPISIPINGLLNCGNDIGSLTGIKKRRFYRPNSGIAHRDLKPANILVSYKHYTNITDAAELNMAT